MGDKINKEYEDFQEYLDKKEKKLKIKVYGVATFKEAIEVLKKL